MALSVGIIIIGSLYWRMDKDREKWRKARLNMGDELLVRLPIRYGRLSQSNTYTMVFSNLCYWKSHGLGSGKIIRCINEVSDIHDLLDEAKALWSAERNRIGNKMWSTWGCVALLRNPNSEQAIPIENCWKTHISNIDSFPIIEHTRREKPIVNKSGILNIDWPAEINNQPINLDLLLCTVNNPTLNPIYPSINEIALAWKKAGDDQYFRMNRENNITTFQDNRLIDLLA